MRLLRWVPLLLAVIGIYYLANRAKEVKADRVMAEAPAHLGISNRDWDHWTMIAQQIREGHIPDLTDSDWRSLKKLCTSADATVKDSNVKLLGALKDTPYRDQAIALSERLTKDSSSWVRKMALENLKQLVGDDGSEKPKDVAAGHMSNSPQ